MRFDVGSCAHRSSDFRRLQSTLLTTGATASLLARRFPRDRGTADAAPAVDLHDHLRRHRLRLRGGRQIPTVSYAERFRMA
jgi:hypothetical protein